MAVWIRRIVAVLVMAAVLGGLAYALLPRPVTADLAVVERGPMEVTIDEEGIARVKDIYRISAPIPGHLARFPLEVGDPVKRGETVVAELRPSSPSFLDARSRRELEGAVRAAESAVSLAEAELSQAQSELRMTRSDLARSERLAETGTIPERALEQAISRAETAEARVERARANLALRRSELESARARLIEPGDEPGVASGGSCCYVLRAPVDGVVLSVSTESEQVVQAGATIAEIGDPGDLEIVVDLLSTDAVRVRPRAPARIVGWGSEESLSGRVRRVEPTAFTKVSALGIEEQRVNVILDLLESTVARSGLGHGFRVMAQISVWRGENVLKVPLSALFRRGNDWAVFRVVDRKAALTPVTIDHRTLSDAEVVDGVKEGDVVVLHPSDKVQDGTRIEPRADPG